MWNQQSWRGLTLLLSILFLTSCARTTPLSKEDLAAALRDNPEVLLEALEENSVALVEIVEKGFKERQESARKAELELSVRTPLKPSIDTDRPFLGNVDAPVTMVEYSDFFCQYCAPGTRTAKLFFSRHPETLRFFYKHLPLQQPSLVAATYFEGVAMQDTQLAWQYMEAIFSDQSRFLQGGEAALNELARELGLDLDRLAADVKSQAIQERIARDMQEASALGIKGTPTFIVGGVPIRGAASLEEFENVLHMVVSNSGQQEPAQ
jgi:protein-disulfide isomerase